MNSLASLIRGNPNFKWQNGMRAIKTGPSGASGRVVNYTDTPKFRGLHVSRGDREDFERKKSVPVNNASCVPDLQDPATGGILFQELLSEEITLYSSRHMIGEAEGEFVVTLSSRQGYKSFFGNSLGEVSAKALLYIWENKQLKESNK